ncbi:hypothetical protein MJO28_011551 [Puccinia striiformis f. sp. tritici]|uniref:Uncharacterized protein n=1 Tax=Puccinia striiformis f. sp. tritici TaxID=168172 RepID=A0ACC0E2K3_9BASI|nr:hypothetical protein MJO28_011551 [Puccinia striiformis f. sp. tritici]
MTNALGDAAGLRPGDGLLCWEIAPLCVLTVYIYWRWHQSAIWFQAHPVHVRNVSQLWRHDCVARLTILMFLCPVDVASKTSRRLLAAVISMTYSGVVLRIRWKVHLNQCSTALDIPTLQSRQGKRGQMQHSKELAQQSIQISKG